MINKRYCFRIGIIAKQFANVTDKKEPWYGTDYKITHIPEETISVKIEKHSVRFVN